MLPAAPVIPHENERNDEIILLEFRPYSKRLKYSELVENSNGKKSEKNFFHQAKHLEFNDNDDDNFVKRHFHSDEFESAVRNDTGTSFVQ